MSDGDNGRPASFYDNYGGDDGAFDGYTDDRYERLRNEMLGYERAKSPTQTISLLTTVPQNITPMNIGSKHAPTRQSLRHSRMIVMNRHSAVPNGNSQLSPMQRQPIQRFHSLARVLVILQCLFGVVICALSFWIYIFAPNIKQRDNPYWSGIPLLISGLFGLLLVCCSRDQLAPTPRNIITYSTKILSIFLSVVAGAVCLIASAFAFLHLLGLAFMDCETALHFNNTCICTTTNATSIPPFVMAQYHYKDLQCPELNNFFVFLLIGSCGCNLIAGVLTLWFVYLHWSSRRYLYDYTKVNSRPTDANGINVH